MSAELRSVCKRQRSSGKSIRSALVRKQGELDVTSAEAARLRAELGFIIGDMLVHLLFVLHSNRPDTLQGTIHVYYHSTVG